LNSIALPNSIGIPDHFLSDPILHQFNEISAKIKLHDLKNLFLQKINLTLIHSGRERSKVTLKNTAISIARQLINV